ncbi:MAG: tetratricopeptide repeat protein [Aureispira sp.]|nr:tetratricopeptide repeat protein [Aureispira sp.]
MSKTPFVRQIAWVAVGTQFLIIIGLVFLLKALGVKEYLIIGTGVYISLTVILQFIVPRYHRKGIALLRKKKYAEALEVFKESRSFFEKKPWVDRYRAITALSSSSMSYREMALLNIGFCYIQLGDNQKAKNAYTKALEEYPNSGLAISALKFFETAEKAPKKKEETNLLKDEQDFDLV